MRLKITSATLISCLPFFAGASADTKRSSPEQTTSSIRDIVVKKIKGSAKFRAPDSSIWKTLSIDQKLTPGEIIYTDINSRVSIQFDDDENALEIPPNWIFEVKNRLPKLTSINRHAHVIKASEDAMVLRDAPSREPVILKQPQSWLGLKRKHIEFNVQSPSKNFQLNALVFPVSFRVELPDHLPREDFRALVWESNHPQRPILNLKINHKQSEITLQEPGRYILSVFNQSEEHISNPININAIFFRRSSIFRQIKDSLSNENNSSIFVD